MIQTTERIIEKWARGQICLDAGIGTGTPVKVTADGGKIRVTGHSYQWWTPSGKTRVYHPRAYGWRTMYVHATHVIHVPLAALPSTLRRDLIAELVTGLRRPIKQTAKLRRLAGAST